MYALYSEILRIYIHHNHVFVLTDYYTGVALVLLVAWEWMGLTLQT